MRDDEAAGRPARHRRQRPTRPVAGWPSRVDRPRRRWRRLGPTAAVLAVLIAVAAAVAVLAVPWTGTAPGLFGGQAGGQVAGAAAPGGKPPQAGSPPPAAKPTPSPKTRVVQRGEGTFRPARGGSERVGDGGKLLRYRVEVENGIDQDQNEFARLVDAVLADPRGWTGDGRRAFQRTATGPHDFVVRLASPDTVDEICGQYGLATNGEVSCRGAENVVINVRRWLLAIPSFNGNVAMYRHAVVNHEVGHFLGFGHEKCPGPGRPIPVMGTPFYGMDGCQPNGWPYPNKR